MEENTMKNLNMKSAIKRYNGIMQGMGYDHLTIGTSLSEGTDNWNIRDMVCECDYQLSMYYDEGNINGELRYSDDESDRKAWASETGKLKRFIAAYVPFIENVKCTDGHGSKYDN